MEQFEKVCKGLECCNQGERCRECPYAKTSYDPEQCIRGYLLFDAIALIRQQQERIKAQDEVIRALRNVGYPHNFQREPTWIVNYMYAITDVIKKAVKLE